MEVFVFLFLLSGCDSTRDLLIATRLYDPDSLINTPISTIVHGFIGKPASAIIPYLGKPDVERSGVWEWGGKRWVMVNDSMWGDDMREYLHREVCMLTAELDKNDIILSLSYEKDIKKGGVVKCPGMLFPEEKGTGGKEFISSD